MSTTQDIIGSVAAPAVDLIALSEAIDAIQACERAATACAMGMVAEDHPMTAEIHAALDNADLAGVALRVLSRTAAADRGVLRAAVEACAVASERSASLCGAHAGHHEHCRLHSEAAARAATACRDLLADLGD